MSEKIAEAADKEIVDFLNQSTSNDAVTQLKNGYENAISKPFTKADVLETVKALMAHITEPLQLEPVTEPINRDVYPYMFKPIPYEPSFTTTSDLTNIHQLYGVSVLTPSIATVHFPSFIEPKVLPVQGKVIINDNTVRDGDKQPEHESDGERHKLLVDVYPNGDRSVIHIHGEVKKPDESVDVKFRVRDSGNN